MAPTFWQIALDPSVRKRALRISLIVGSVIALINHGDRMIMGTMDMVAVLKCIMTYGVPYAVSTYSSVMAVRDRQQILDES